MNTQDDGPIVSGNEADCTEVRLKVEQDGSVTICHYGYTHTERVTFTREEWCRIDALVHILHHVLDDRKIDDRLYRLFNPEK